MIEKIDPSTLGLDNELLRPEGRSFLGFRKQSQSQSLTFIVSFK